MVGVRERGEDRVRSIIGFIFNLQNWGSVSILPIGYL